VEQITVLTAGSVAEFNEDEGVIGRRRQVSAVDVERYLEAAARRYREAFRGPPWFERSRCLSGCSSKAEFCDSEPGTRCDIAGRPTSDEAHPVKRTTEDLKRLLDERKALISIEHDGGHQGSLTARCGAVFWVSTAQDLWSARYGLVPAMQQWLVEEFGDRTFLYRDEVFGDLERPGNLRYYRKLCMAAAADLGQTLLVGRTINGAVMHVLACEEFRDAVRVLAPVDARVRGKVGVPVRCCPYVQAVVPDDRYIVVVDLTKAKLDIATA
jgi:hypothetical protein